MKKATTADEEECAKKRCLDLLERYVYLILFNAYLHCDRHNKWQRRFSAWMAEVCQTLHGSARWIQEFVVGDDPSLS